MVAVMVLLVQRAALGLGTECARGLASNGTAVSVRGQNGKGHR